MPTSSSKGRSLYAIQNYKTPKVTKWRMNLYVESRLWVPQVHEEKLTMLNRRQSNIDKPGFCMSISWGVVTMNFELQNLGSYWIVFVFRIQMTSPLTSLRTIKEKFLCVWAAPAAGYTTRYGTHKKSSKSKGKLIKLDGKVQKFRLRRSTLFWTLFQSMCSSRLKISFF